MPLAFRLKKLLDDRHHNRHGIIKEIADGAGLERHKVSEIFHGHAKTASLETVARLCDYLVSHLKIDRGALPGALFGWQPGEFWGLCRDVARVETRTAVRGDMGDAEERVINEADAILQGMLVRRVTRTAEHPPVDEEMVTAFVRVSSEKQALVYRTVRDTGLRVYNSFRDAIEKSALVCVGSMKCNPLTECVIANNFQGAEAFQPQESVKDPAQRACPFYLRYRDTDLQVPSCAGGVQLTNGSTEPAGILYEDESGNWQCCPSDDENDAAIVLYSFVDGKVEAVLGGFSARATRCLAGRLGEIADSRLWPPGYDAPEIKLGAFIVTFSFEKGSEPFPKHYGFNVISLQKSLERRAIRGRRNAS